MAKTSSKAPRKESRKNDSISMAEANKIELILFSGSVILLLFLIYTIQPIVSPFLLLGAILFLLYPLRSFALAKNVMWLAVALFSLWLLYTVWGVISPFIVSLLAAYILHPLITKLEEWGIPRWLSSLVIILLLIGLLTVILFLVLPFAFQQFEGILDAVNAIVSQITQWLVDGRVVVALRRYGISTQQLRDTITSNFAPRLENIIKGLLEGAFGLVSGLTTVVSRIVNLVIIPFLAFYVLKDFPLIKHRVKMLFPHAKREKVKQYYQRIDELLGRYIRGAITVAFINAVLVASFFWIFGIQYPLVMGIVAGVLDLIPYFGLIIMLLLSVVVAFYSGAPVIPHIILAAATIGALHVLEAAVLSPKIIGSKVGIHPALLILSLLIFSFFLGFIGLLIAVPTTAIIILLIQEWQNDKNGTAPSLLEQLPDGLEK
jgi:predicted PurR-regulated permease PerM